VNESPAKQPGFFSADLVRWVNGAWGINVRCWQILLQKSVETGLEP